MVLHDPPDDVVSGFGGVVMADHLCVLVEDRFEKSTGQAVLASFAVLGREIALHVGNENDILQRRVTAKVTEHLEVPSSDSGKPTVRDTVDVDDSGKRGPFLVSIGKFSVEDREADEWKSVLTWRPSKLQSNSKYPCHSSRCHRIPGYR